ncbi:MAG: DUF354 domain-containing protein [Gammaproteobacteria bacterium]
MPSIIIDSHHPKHYLTLRQLGRRCRDAGIEVVWTGRKKDVLIDLMRQDGIEPVMLTSGRRSLGGKLVELALYDWRLLCLARRVRPSALIGKAISLAHVGCLLRIPNILINDDSAAANPQYRYLGYPFATRILTAECLGESYGSRQRTYPGLMELAYLHPNVFSPDPKIRGELGVSEEERLFLVRLAAFDAYHDVGQHGLSGALLRRTMDRLMQEGRVFICSEAPLTGDYTSFALPVAASRLHHVLAACDLVLGDGLTVCVEAALLGTPAIAIGSYMGKHTYFRELEQRFRLMWGFRPVQEEEFLSCVTNVLGRHDLKEEWQRRRAAMLDVWGDPTDVFWEELQALLRRRAPGQHRPDLPQSAPS